MNFRTITKNHTAYPEKGLLTKSISKPYSRATAMPPALELKMRLLLWCQKIFFRNFYFKNESKANNVKLCYIMNNRGSYKFNFTAVQAHKSIPTA